MLTKIRETTGKIDEHTELLRLVLQEVRAMRKDFQRSQNGVARLAHAKEVEDDDSEDGEAIIFNAERDNDGNPLTARELQDILDKIDG